MQMAYLLTDLGPAERRAIKYQDLGGTASQKLTVLWHVQ